MRNGFFLLILLIITWPSLQAQRNYANSSVLQTGNWYKISVKETGIYKVDMALLNKLGVNTANLSSTSIRLFGNGGTMLPEACNGFKNDDLVENAIQLSDGGDGIFNGNDYFLFYATGPDTWFKDSANLRFKHQKNLYSTLSYYYINISAGGKRVSAQAAQSAANTTVNSFSERYFHELDSVNFLNSSKDWYGEEFSTMPGHATGKAFAIPISNIITAQPATIVSNCVARSIGGGSSFSLTVNGQSVLQQNIDAVGSTNLDLFAKNLQSAATFNAVNNFSVVYSFTPGGINAEGWIDWFEIYCRKNLSLAGNEQMQFRDWNSVAAGSVASFTVQNANAAQVWDVTDRSNPVKMNTTANGNDLTFINDASSLHEYIAFSANFLTPLAVGKVANQDLHNLQPADLIIVTYPPLLQAAQRIAAFHQKDNLKTVIATTEQVYNEFSSGLADPSAIRDFVKMYYDKAAGDSTKRPRYLLLLGDASFDYKDRIKSNTNYVPAYENSFSLDPLSTYTSDDFFGYLDDNEDINSGAVINLLDIGIGRIPAQTLAQANAYADKLIAYTDIKSLGPWRNQQTFIADDQDQNLHFNDAEAITAAAAATNPLFVQDKIYLDAYRQTSTPAGSRYPDVNEAINNQVQNGTLIWNYNGHGSSTRLAEEVVLEQDIADTWTNNYRLPLFITATCDFAPYDNPAINSLGENILLRDKTGAIALMTTTRLVFAFSNRIMNRNYLQAALQPRPDGSYMSLGDAVRQAKNFTYQTQADITNNRKFTLLGDPALTLAYPKYRIQTDSINGNAVNTIPDTLKALAKYSIKGSVRDAAGNLQTGFNGTVYVTVFDKVQTISTLGNDADSYPQNFQVQRNQVFNGTAKVSNGNFDFNFIVPKDINYQLGNGRISYYADNGEVDGNGNFTGFLVGESKDTSKDNAGPIIKAYLDSTSFINGATVNATPLLLVNLSDSSGINIMGTGIGHDITAIIDGDEKQTFVLNGFFESGPDSYQNGSVRFQMPAIAAGNHTMVIKAWDVANNSSEVTIRFNVMKDDGLTISYIRNYPNPFRSQTNFFFGHNRPNEDLKVSINIFTLYGQLVKTIKQTINTTGTRSSDIQWDATDSSGHLLNKGIYIYQIQVVCAADGKMAVKAGKLIID